MTPLFTLPAATTTLTGISDYSSNTFLAFLPLVYLLAGVVIGALVISALVAAFIGGAKKITGPGRGGRRRGRR